MIMCKITNWNYNLIFRVLRKVLNIALLNRLNIIVHEEFKKSLKNRDQLFKTEELDWK